MKRAIRLNANICLLSNPLKHCGNAGLSMKEKLYLRAFATRATATHNGWIWKGSENLSHPLSNCSRKEDWRGRYKSKQVDMARLFITGASGLLGINLAVEAMREHEVIGVDRGKLKSAPFQVLKADILKLDEISSTLDAANPHWMVNCAALANLEKCEAD